MQHFPLARTLLALSLAVAASGAARAVPWRVDDHGESPYFASDDGGTAPLVLESTTYTVDVSGVVAHAHVTQSYANHGGSPIDARYVFPLSTRAAVFGMTMQVGKRRIAAEIEERVAAEAIYQAARDAGRAASIVSQHRPNVFETRVANIAPAERVVVELDYVELLVPTDAVYELVIPAAIGPRYVGGPSRDADWVAAAAAGMGNSTWTVDVHIDAGVPVRAVTSSSHRLQLRDNSDGTADVAFAEPPDRRRDLIIRYALAGDAVHAGVLRFKGSQEKYFLALVVPPARVPPASVLARELVFIVDVSGSMNGFPIETSKALMRELIAQLHPWERFNILTFAGGRAVLAPESLLATPANRARADAFLARFDGSGGTELLPAMSKAYALPNASDMVRSIAILTDGLVTVEAPVFQLVRQNLGAANVFAFGIGASVNRFIIEGLARAGRAEPFVVESGEYAADAASAFRAYVDAPVLAGVRATFDGVETYDVEPPLSSLPDVFANRPLVFFGKYRGDGGTLTLSGRSISGPWSESIALDAARESPRHTAIATLWARERIARLGDVGPNTDSARAEVRRLGLEHHLVTAYTSFVAVERGVAPDGAVTQQRGPLVPSAPVGGDPLAMLDGDGDGLLDRDDGCPGDPQNRCNCSLAEASIGILDQVYFRFRSAAIDAQKSAPILDAVAEVFARNPWILKVEVRGHSEPGEGSGRGAERLAFARANAVIAYLVAKGVDPLRLVATSYASSQPLDTNKTADGRAKNRRVQFEIVDPTWY